MTEYYFNLTLVLQKKLLNLHQITTIMNNQTCNNYTPTPVDTGNVQLPKELMALAEAISKNVHEVWAQNRMNEGWTYGPVRDDQKRQTPCLVPYEQLSEEEKAYDLNTAFGTLKFIVSQGFEITKKT